MPGFNRSGLVVAVGGLALGAILASCGTMPGSLVLPPAVEGATFVGNQACADCHNELVRGFASSPHARMHIEGVDLAEPTGCEGCHGPGSKHVAAGGGRQFIVNPSKDPNACLDCHVQIHAEFGLPYRHPVLEGKMTCAQCHDPHGMDILRPARGLAFARDSESCVDCHREQTRPVVFEHEGMRDGCMTCHQPHGSLNAKLLAEPDSNLCLRCHAQVQGPGVQPGDLVIGKVNHTILVRFGTCWSAGCHTAIHGSLVNSKFLY